MSNGSTSNPLASREKEMTDGMAADNLPMAKEAIFEDIDADQDGSISFREFFQWWAGRQTATKGTVDSAMLQGASDHFFRYKGGEQVSQLQFFEILAELSLGQWQEAKDPTTGRTYFVDPGTRASRWDRPALSDFLLEQGIVEEFESDSEEEQQQPKINQQGEELSMQLNLWKIYRKSEYRRSVSVSGGVTGAEPCLNRVPHLSLHSLQWTRRISG